MLTEELKDINDVSLAIKTSGCNKDPALIFIHGASQNSDTWLPQLGDKELSEKYFLLAFDLPGHGKSDRLNNPENYKPAKIILLIKRLIAAFEIQNYILVGLSYGTNVIGEIKEPLKKCKGICLLSPCIVNETHIAPEFITAGTHGHVIAAENPREEDLKAFALEHLHSKKMALHFTQTYRKTDPAFRTELAKSLLEGDLTDELKNIQNLRVPLCIAFGKKETLIRNNYLDDFKPVWKNKIFLIEESGHLINEENPNAINKLLASFAAHVFK